MSTHYDTLHVTESAPDEVIRAAHRALALRYHPDRAGNDPRATKQFLRINDAYNVLADPAQRAAYDETLRRARDPRPAPQPSPPPQRRHRTWHEPIAGPNAISQLIAALSDPRIVLPVAGLLLVVTFFVLRAWR